MAKRTEKREWIMGSHTLEKKNQMRLSKQPLALEQTQLWMSYPGQMWWWRGGRNQITEINRCLEKQQVETSDGC